MGAPAVSGLRPVSAPVMDVGIVGTSPLQSSMRCLPAVVSVLLYARRRVHILVQILKWGWTIAVFQICATSSGPSILDPFVLSRCILMHVHPEGAVHLFRDSYGTF